MRFSTELSDRRTASHRALQNRLRALFFSLGLVFVGFMLARDPKNWFWLAPPQPQDAAKTNQPETDKPRPQIDDSPLRPGEIRIPIPAPGADSTPAIAPSRSSAGNADSVDNAAAADAGDATDRQTRTNPQNPRPRDNSATASLPQTAAELRKLIGTINDNTVGLRASEAAAYWKILNGIHNQSIAPKPAEILADVTFAELDTDPADYRGRWLSFVGEFRRINRLETPPAANVTAVAEQTDADASPDSPPPVEPPTDTDDTSTTEADRSNTVKSPPSQPEPAGPSLPVVYEGWFFTDDAGPRNPYRIVFTHLPDSLPTGDSVRVAARVTGLFFKRQSYQTLHGLHAAPLLLTREPAVIAAPKSTQKQRDEQRTNLTYLFAVAGLIVTMVAYNLARWGIGPNRAADAPATTVTNTDFSKLAVVDNAASHGIHPPETSGNANA